MKAVLRLKDCKTQRDVVLVGTMHYNPTSISLAESMVRAEAEAGQLRAVVLESCPTRWTATMEKQPPGSLLRRLCDNEMQAAAETADAYSCAVKLGDQTIEETGERIVQLLALTVVQLGTPFAGGWGRIAEDLRCGLAELSCAGGLQPGAFLDLRLLAFLPVAISRYVLALAVKSPALLLAVAALIGAPLLLSELGAPLEPLSTEQGVREALGAVGISALEAVVFGRILLVGLLEERNFALARSIRRESQARGAKAGETVVAVLGMAHLNGVKRILTTSRVV